MSNSKQIDIFKAKNEVSFSLKSLFAQYADEKSGIEQISEFVLGKDGLIEYFLAGNKSPTYLAKEMFSKSGAIKSLDSKYWQKAIDMTDVLDCMPAKKRSEWNTMIHDMQTPSFEPHTVVETITSLLAGRSNFMAERVDGIFRSLSGKHVTNSPLAFRERMIIEYVSDSYGYLNHKRAEYIHDLREVIARLENRDCLPSYQTSRDLGLILRNEEFGQWIDFDGGAFRVKLFKNGNAHLEIHEDAAIKLNEILASLYPSAIASESARSSTSANKKPKSQARLKMLSQEVIKHIADVADSLSSSPHEYVFYERDSVSDRIIEETSDVLMSLGAELSQCSSKLVFPFDPSLVLSQVVRIGCVPEKISHQFFPTPKELALRAIELAEVAEEMSVLEPSAGQGGISDYLDKKNLTCVELSGSHCEILRSKGFKVVQDDFLDWVPSKKFSRIIMNPPFSKGAALAHLIKASEVLGDDGVIVAILPASMKDKNLLRGFKHTYSEVIRDAFEDTGVAVVILKLERK